MCEVVRIGRGNDALVVHLTTFMKGFAVIVGKMTSHKVIVSEILPLPWLNSRVFCPV